MDDQLINKKEQLKNRIIDALKEEAYIYGCGIVGKRLFDAICSIDMDCRIMGFIITKKNENEEATYCKKEIYQLNEIKDTSIRIIVAVSDAYQNEILSLLRQRGFNNVINGYLYSFLNEKHIPEYMPEEIPEIINIDLNELMIMQFEHENFIAYDILIRVMMFSARDIQERIDNEVVVDKYMRVIRGRDSIANALCSDSHYITIKQVFDEYAPIYDINWLESHYQVDEVKRVFRYLEIAKKIWIKPMIGIIWPNAISYSEEIIEEFNSFQDCCIGNKWNILLNCIEFKSFVNRVYYSDDMEKWKIDIKLKNMCVFDQYRVTIFEFYLFFPRFRIKRFGHTISESGMRIKDAIREKYKKIIPNYVEDVILHTTDNYSQASYAKNIIMEYI